MNKQVTELKDKHKGEDIWVLGSGASLNHIQPSFFENKIAVGTNRVSKFFPCNYSVAKDPSSFGEILNSKYKSKLVLAKKAMGCFRREDNGPKLPPSTECYIFEHNDNRHHLDTSCLGTDKITVSYSSITSAIHFAAYLGASNIILCGHDCGMIDEKTSLDGYYQTVKREQSTDSEYRKWLTEIEQHTIKLKKKIKEVYGTNVYSLNPFINLGMEGHTYRRG